MCLFSRLSYNMLYRLFRNDGFLKNERLPTWNILGLRAPKNEKDAARRGRANPSLCTLFSQLQNTHQVLWPFPQEYCRLSNVRASSSNFQILHAFGKNILLKKSEKTRYWLKTRDFLREFVAYGNRKGPNELYWELSIFPSTVSEDACGFLQRVLICIDFMTK